MNKIHKGTRKGFTLLEILLVIAAIGILSTIALVAINPNRQLAQARNLKRKSDINAIYNALEKYTVRNRGNTYPGITFTLQEICNTGTRSTTDDLPDTNYCEGKADLRALVPTYIAAIPVDPQGGAYRVSINSDNNIIAVTAPEAELGQTIAINPPPPPSPKFVATSCTYTDKKISIPYTAGEVGYNYASQTINSTGMTGLTATLTSGTLSASGTLEYEVTGTPSGGGTANFNLSNISNIGVGCNNSNIAVNVTETVLDSNYNNVALLINGNGTNGSTSIIDSSSNSNTVAAFGNSQISNVQSKFGGSSVYFDGSGDYFQTATNAGLALGSGAFTIEAWVRPANTTAGYRGIVGDNVYSDANGFALYQNGTAIEIWFGGSPATRIINATNCLTAGEYQHIAWTRSSTGVNRLFVNGVQRGGDSTNSTNLTATTLRIGRVASGSSLYDFNGYIDDLRITKGVARYTSDFSSSLPAELPTSGNTLTY